ncbi:MAG: ABC transporter ATP-binding protein [Clostridium sp.]|uniref:ABC transporter ATP-binding protein n=1 Tax=Clostridium sp. TaxID=1506 RepID=UPI001EB7EDE8|nr:ABC transporter ATP-binding protein [Clostridium sp.]MBS5885461.1 ABC transporter ATP-binding protein [Clostridium sp.]MDU7149686.1 ABC transporter ATP-binding protein [Clostridium sp.]MDU7240651.1 ABC transporter ATP-binding protein [Clostridium sp.]
MKNAINIKNLKVGYDKKIIIEELNLSLEKGKITSIIGSNGCGKSTLLKSIGRILKKENGEIFILDKNMNDMKSKEIAEKLAILSQNPTAPSQLKVEELVSYGRYPHRTNVSKLSNEDKQKIEWALKVTNTFEFRYRELSDLSGGQRQRVWLAMALAQETDILLLDEPTTFLDMSHQLEVLNIVKNLNDKHGCTVVMVLHDVNHAAKYSDFIVAMKDGKILYKNTPDLIMSKEVLKDIYNINAELITNENYNVPLCLNYELL